jgi:hypothetical protein
LTQKNVFLAGSMPGQEDENTATKEKLNTGSIGGVGGRPKTTTTAAPAIVAVTTPTTGQPFGKLSKIENFLQKVMDCGFTCSSKSARGNDDH